MLFRIWEKSKILQFINSRFSGVLSGFEIERLEDEVGEDGDEISVHPSEPRKISSFLERPPYDLPLLVLSYSRHALPM